MSAATALTATITETILGVTDSLPTAVTTIAGQPSPTIATQHVSLLAIMPDFAFSMPAQITVNGVNLALACILATHLLFTFQYHFPLSKKNYVLQLTSALVLLLFLSVHLHLVLSQLKRRSMAWPYMFPYIGVEVPPQDGSWTNVQTGFYLLMRAATTALVHLTNIQFLTLLFPSAVEARLIFWMLGPLAIAASGMEFTELSPEADVKTSDLGDAIRNICNSTLALLYTAALLIWGLAVNRTHAWRTDGGTAAFGAGSVGLAFINTAIAFVEIGYDRLWWLPDICWTLTIWQSWLGFWWWVGSGMGIGEVEERAERLAKKRKREERRKRKLEKEERHRAKMAALAAEGDSDVMVGIKRLKDRITGGDRSDSGTQNALSRRLRRGNTGSKTGDGANSALENMSTGASANGVRADEAQNVPSATPQAELTSVNVVPNDTQDGDDARTVTATSGTGSSTNPTGSSSANASWPGWFGSLVEVAARYQPDFIRRRIKRLRLAHVAAARVAATEQTVLREQVLNHGRRGGVPAPGLRSMVFERGDRGTVSSLRASNDAGSTWQQGFASPRTLVQSLPLPIQEETPRSDSNSDTRVPTGSSSWSSGRRMSPTSPPVDGADTRQRPNNNDEDWEDEAIIAESYADGNGPDEIVASADQGAAHAEEPRARSRRRREESSSRPSVASPRVASTSPSGAVASSATSPAADEEAGSWFWRGGLRRARLRDSTRYD